jgi:hypothetical protein
LVEGARAVPTVGAGVGLTAMGVPPPIAFGGTMYGSTFAATGDPTEAAKSGMIGMVLPGVGEAGRTAAAKVMSGAIRQGVVSSAANVPQKIVEAMAAQGAIQVFLEGLNVPAYLQMNPEERKQTLIRNLVANSAFAVMDLPGIVRRGPSAAQARLGPDKLASAQVGEMLAKIVNDPAAVESLRQAADKVALEAARPAPAPRGVQTSGRPAVEAPPTGVVPRETALAEVPAGLQTRPSSLVDANGMRAEASGETAAAKTEASATTDSIEVEARRRYELNRELSETVYSRVIPSFDEAVQRLVDAGETPERARNYLIELNVPPVAAPDLLPAEAGQSTPPSAKSARGGPSPARSEASVPPSVMADPEMGGVRVVGRQFEAKTPGLARKLAKDWTRQNLIGMHRNDATGWEIEVTRAGLDKATSGARPNLAAHLETLRGLPDLLRGATLAETKPDRANDPNIKAIHLFSSPVEVNGQRFSAKITVKETRQGKRFYDHSLLEPESSAGTLAGDTRSKTGQRSPPSTAEPRPNVRPPAGPVNGGLGFPAAPPPATPPVGTPGVALLFNARVPVTLARTAPGTIAIPEVMAALENVVRAAGGQSPIRTGRFDTKRARGVYNPQTEVVRINSADNIATGAHEIGHASQKLLYGSAYAAGLRGLPPAVKRELIVLGKALYGSTRPAAGYSGEGWAEFLRLYLSTDDAAAKAPTLEKYFREKVLVDHPEFARAIEQARRKVDVWRAQGSEARARAQLVKAPGRLARIIRTLRDTVSIRAQVDEFEPLWRLSQGYAERSGNVLAPAQDPFLLSSWKRGTAGAVVETMVNDRMIDPWGNPLTTGPSLSLKQALAPVKGRGEEFALYLFGRRALERWSKNQNPGLTKDDAAYLVQRFDSPEFQLAAQNYYEWHRGLLEYVRAADPAMGPTIDAIMQGSRDYAPLARVIDPAGATAAAAAARSNPLMRMHGSGRQVRDIFETTIENAARMVSHAHRKMVLEAIVKLSKREGMGFLVEEVPRSQVRTEVNFEKLRAELEQLGVDTSGVSPDTILAYFDLADRPKGVDPIVVVNEADGPHWYHVAPEVFELLNGLEIKRLPPMVDLLLGAPARAFRLGTTGLRASFSLVTNFARDLRTFILQTQADANPARLAGAYFSALGEVVRAGFGRAPSPHVEAFYRLGAQLGQPLGIDINHTKRAAKGLFHGKVMRHVTNPVDMLRDLLQITESAPRVAELKLIADEVGWQPGQPITPDQAVQMALAAKRVTVDFSAAGSIGRVLNQVIPFYNATIQGTRSFARALRDRPGRAILYGPGRAILYGLATYTIPALLNWWRNKDEEWYRQLPWRERYLYDNVADHDGNVWQIPRPPEWGNMFSVLPEAMLDSWYRQDPRGAGEALKHLLATTNPLDWPVPVRIAKEQWQNRIEFFDRPIVPRSQIDLPPGEQRGPYTTRLAEWIGDAFPNVASPRRIDAAVRGYFGGAVPDLLDAIGVGSRKRDRENELSDIPVLGRWFRRGGEFSPANLALGDYYDELTRLSARIEADSKAMREGRQPLNPLTPGERAFGDLLEESRVLFKLGMQAADEMQEAEPRRIMYRNMARYAETLLSNKPKPTQ